MKNLPGPSTIKVSDKKNNRDNSQIQTKKKFLKKLGNIHQVHHQ